MHENVSADARRRSSLRLVAHSLPLAVLREEHKSAQGSEGREMKAKALSTDIESVCRNTVDARRGSLTDRPRLSLSYVQFAQQIQRANDESFTLSPIEVKPASLARDEHALSQLRATYIELQTAQSLPRTSLSVLPCIQLPPPSKQYTLVFDLDETLVHREIPTPCSETIISVSSGCGSYLIGLSVRPYVAQCLAELAKHWELIVFTASQKAYADAIVDYLDPNKSLFAHRLYREHCLYVHSKPVKDLRMLQHRDLHRTVIVDNSLLSFAYQLNNGIPIRPWSGCLKDREMLKVNRLLRRIVTAEDVREELKKVFDLEHFCRDYRKAQRKASCL